MSDLIFLFRLIRILKSEVLLLPIFNGFHGLNPFDGQLWNQVGRIPCQTILLPYIIFKTDFPTTK